MRIATWNVNSVRARQQRLLDWLAGTRPDVLCLQELKCSEEAFPFDVLSAHGYHAVVAGQKTYNGVAVLSRSPAESVRRGLDDGVDDPQARLVSARVDGVRFISVYVPNGSEVGSDKYAYKLRWLERLSAYLDRHHAPAEPLALCGDFNVAPEEIDVHHPERWLESVLCHAEAREAMQRVTRFGLVDLFRKAHPEGGAYSWWDYRRLAFPKNDGLRIDMIYGSESLAARMGSASIDRDERKGSQPSDHAPVVVDVATS